MKNTLPDNQTGCLNWHAHGESNPGYRRERAMSYPLDDGRGYLMAHPERFERPTLWFVARYSIQLSYGCVFHCALLSAVNQEKRII